MIEVVLNRNYYHKQDEIYKWCMEQFGKNGGYTPTPEATWHYSIAFGQQIVAFKNGPDASLFALKWK